MATAEVKTQINRIHQGDCVRGMQKLPDGSIDLAFADPPFNIGYEYDEYDDRLEAEKYIDWCKEWMTEVHRVLKSDGAFWLAIGDEYAAELKVAAQSIGFTTRSWVIWYYTFGVNCKAKFTRSHAHLFYFIKDPEHFTFNRDAIAVPSARQLVYNDSRSNPKGRLPDDTWILRPQDCVESLTPDEDLWYFPRVNGTFKERAGFHGCQMPEQLLGRIIKSCSNVGQVVLDPFSGSATTLAVAKKLDRGFVGFELSKEYAKRGTERLSRISAGDPLEGAEEPKVSVPSTKEAAMPGRGRKVKAAAATVVQQSLDFGDDLWAAEESLVKAFQSAARGFSVDRVIVDPILNEDFQRACEKRSVPGLPLERNLLLLRLRKAGRLKYEGIAIKKRTESSWEEIDRYVFASEIAWTKVSELTGTADLEEIFCDPRKAELFDSIAARYVSGITAMELRWSALRLRKELIAASKRAESKTAKQLEIDKFTKETGTKLSLLDMESIPESPGVYSIGIDGESMLYVGETDNLRRRLEVQCEPARAGCWTDVTANAEHIVVTWQEVDSLGDARLARQVHLSRRMKSCWNLHD